MMQITEPEKQITIKIECFTDKLSEGDKCKYIAWIQNPEYKGIMESEETIYDALMELAKSLQATEVYRNNMKTNKKD